MFFEKQPAKNKNEYMELLEIIGSLSNLFSESSKPYLHYRATENLFCMCLEAKNLSRSDCTADASKGALGIGIKTFLDTPNSNSFQKIAEFSKGSQWWLNEDNIQIRALQACYTRNERIEFTKRTHGLDDMIYHYTVRDTGKISIIECNLDLINIGALKFETRGKNTLDLNVIHFNDGLNEYSFNTSKSTLYKRFYTNDVITQIPVSIIKNPCLLLKDLFKRERERLVFAPIKDEPHVFLPLYSTRGERVVAPKSGLNQWNASGRARHADELYIPVPSIIHRIYEGFFPDNKDTIFKLELPNGEILSAKMCQEGQKGLMSNPNKDLGHWILRDVLRLKEGELVTIKMLDKIGVDSVVVYKKSDDFYTIDFANTGSYENFISNTNLNDDEVSE